MHLDIEAEEKKSDENLKKFDAQKMVSFNHLAIVGFYHEPNLKLQPELPDSR